MKIFKFTLFVIVILILLTAMLPAARLVSAQSAAGSVAGQADQEGEETIIPLSAWGYNDTTIFGPFGVSYYAIGLPAGWQVLPGGKLILALDYVPSGGSGQDGNAVDSQFLQDQMDVRLNGEQIFSELLTTTGPQSFEILLPDVWPENSGVDRLEVALRVYGPCEDRRFGSITISSGSSLNIAYRMVPLELNLENYPQPFFQRTFLPNQLEIILPENATQAESGAALSIAAGLGNLSANRVEIDALTDAAWLERGPSPDNAMIIGTPDSSGAIIDLIKAAGFPVQVQERRYKLTVTGPGRVQAGQKVSYAFQVENSETSPAAGLFIRSELPDLADQAVCQPECQAAGREVYWQVDSLAPGASAAFAVSYVLANEAATGAMSVTAELAQDHQPVNVATLRSVFQPEQDAQPVQSEPASKFFFVTDGRALSESDGIIQIASSPWEPGKALMMVTGLTGEAVQKAASSLAAQAFFPGKNGQVALVQDVIPIARAPQVENVEVSLESLGYEDRTVYGIGRKDLYFALGGQSESDAGKRALYYTVHLPANWRLTEDAGVRLAFSHSPLLNPKRSSITLLFNNTPIGSVALDETNAINGELIAMIPPRAARPGIPNTLLIRVETDIDDLCIDPETTLAWVMISASSSMRLAHVTDPEPRFIDLDYWPQPFINDSSLGEVLISLPARPTSAEYTTAFQVASFLGATSELNYYRPSLVLGVPPDFDFSQHHILAIGRPTRNPLIQAANDNLPQPFIKGTDNLLQKVDEVVFRLPSKLDLGYVQIIESPYNPQYVLLALTGTSDQGLQLAASFVVDWQRFWEMNGNLALLRGDKVFSTDTRNLTAAGAAGFTASAAPETVEDAEVVEPAAEPQAQVAGVQTFTPTTSIAQRYPYIIPAVLGASALLVVIILIIAYLRPRWGRS